MRRPLLYILLILIVLQSLTGQEHITAGGESKPLPVGNLLCSMIEDMLRPYHSVRIEKQDLIPTTNNMPYNIVAFMGPPQIEENEGNWQIERETAPVIAFCMEDAYLHEPFIRCLIELLKKQGSAAVLLFSYGDTPPYKGARTLNGTFAFAQEISPSRPVLCVSWKNNNRITIDNGGAGETTPEEMLKTLCTQLIQSELPYTVNAGSFGALYRFKMLNQNERVSSFINAGAACCGINLYNGIENEKAARAIASFMHKISMGNLGGTHYIAFNTSKKFYIIGEKLIVLIFIASSFLFTLFVCLPSKRRKTESFRQVLNVLQVLPITLAVCASSFMAGQWMSRLLRVKYGIPLSMQFCTKIFLSFVVITAVYCFVVYFFRPLGAAKAKGQAATEEVYCYMLSIMSLLNMLIFSAIDISTVGVFAAEYVIVMAARKAHTVLSLIISCILMILPYIPYILILSRYADISTLNSLIYASLPRNILYAMLFVPLLMQWLRILSRIFAVKTAIETSKTSPSPAQEASGKLYTIRALLMTALLTLCFGISIFGASKAVNIKRGECRLQIDQADGAKDLSIKMTEMKDGLLKCSARDDNFFGDTLRTISIDTGKQCLEAVTEIKGASSCAVIYCDDFYISNDAARTDTFRLPPYPPQKITFAFSADDAQDASLTVTAIYDASENAKQNENANVYELRRVIIPLKAAGKESG